MSMQLNGVSSFRVLVIGAGGIGCELLKTLVIDLDTIEVSNLNRQFLFNKSHVGKSKSKVAKESILRLNPKASIVAHHDDIHSSKFDIDFFKSFQIVLNALDNRAARSRANKMCILADVPMIDGGTAGFLGQLHVIKKSLTACYDCEPKSDNKRKSYPICTIRNTPSEMIHCVVWSKYLFELIFSFSNGNDAAHQTFEASSTNDQKDIEDDEELLSLKIKQLSDNEESIKEFTSFLLNKYFRDDINKLLTMTELWQSRAQPTPLDILDDSYLSFCDKTVDLDESLDSFHSATLKKYISVFVGSAKKLLRRWFTSGNSIKWDKDDDLIVDFTASAANIRATVFGISLETKFEIKSMAGNIIPAIATTNAIIAGLMVAETLKIVHGKINQCHSVYISKNVSSSKLLLPCKPDPPNPKCPVCAEKSTIILRMAIDRVSLGEFKQFIKKECLFEDFDVLDQRSGKILISSDNIDNVDTSKSLSFFGVKNGAFLTVEDYYLDSIIEFIIHDRVLATNEELTIEILHNNHDQNSMKPSSLKRSSSASGIVVDDKTLMKKISKLDTPSDSGDILIEEDNDSDCEIITS